MFYVREESQLEQARKPIIQITMCTFHKDGIFIIKSPIGHYFYAYAPKLRHASVPSSNVWGA